MHEMCVLVSHTKEKCLNPSHQCGLVWLSALCLCGICGFIFVFIRKGCHWIGRGKQSFFELFFTIFHNSLTGGNEELKTACDLSGIRHALARLESHVIGACYKIRRESFCSFCHKLEFRTWLMYIMNIFCGRTNGSFSWEWHRIIAFAGGRIWAHGDRFLRTPYNYKWPNFFNKIKMLGFWHLDD